MSRLESRIQSLEAQAQDRAAVQPRPVFIPTAVFGSPEAQAQAVAFLAQQPNGIVCRVVDLRKPEA